MLSGSAQQLPAELPNDTACVDANSHLDQVNPSTADKASAKSESEAAAAAAAEAGSDAAGDGSNPTGGIMDMEDGVQHPLGAFKPGKPKSKRKRHIYNKEAVRVRLNDLFLCRRNLVLVLVLAAQMWQLYLDCTSTMEAVIQSCSRVCNSASL